MPEMPVEDTLARDSCKQTKDKLSIYLNPSKKEIINERKESHS